MATEWNFGTKPICPRCDNDWYGLEDWHHGLNANGRMSHQCGFCGVFFSVSLSGGEVTSRLNRQGDDRSLEYYKQKIRFTNHVIAGLLH